MKRKILIIGLVISAGMAYLLWPLTSEAHDIEIDEAMMNGKSSYLTESTSQGSGPNVLIIMVDDLSVADISLYDSDAPVHTPHMNLLANEGVTFNNAYVTHSICSPSRASILTGRYPQRFGYEHQMHDRYLKNRLEYFGFKYFVDSKQWIPQAPTSYPDEEAIEKQGIPASEITIAEMVKKADYSTGLIGKWHGGYAEFNQPCQLGFDEFYGFNASHSLYAPEGTPGIVDQKIDGDWTDPYIWSGQRAGPHAICRDCSEITEDQYLTWRIADESIDYMRRHKDERFLLMSSFNAPHTPLQAPQEYVDMFDHIEDPVKRVHYAMIQSLDDAIGQLTVFLKESGLDSNTMVFLISDNGGAEYNLTTENGEYRGGKITDFEGGLKVPFIMKWDGHIAPGTVYDHPVSSMDIFASTAVATGIPLPTDRVYDGLDLVETLAEGNPIHEHLFWRRGYNASIRDAEWKLTWNTAFEDTMLYEIKNDKYEEKNVAKSHPDVMARLFERHDEWANTLKKPLWPPVIHFTVEEDGRTYYFDN